MACHASPKWPSKSCHVYTATTPGAAAAAVVSMLVIVARAISLRTNAACSMRGIVTSSTYSPCPVSSRGSSLRVTDCPMKRAAVLGVVVEVISTAYDAARMPDNTGLGNTRHAGQVAIVTGAALGIGRATAIRLAADGATVVACDVNQEGLAETAAAIAAAGGEVSALPADVSKQADVDAVVGEAAGKGPVTILANVAGVADYFLPVGELDDETWDRIIAINLTGSMRFARAVVPLMEGAGWGSITNIASVAGPWAAGAAAPPTPRRSTA